MKTLFSKSIIALIFTLSTLAHAAPGDLDLAKFVALANQELEIVYGAQNLEVGETIYFQDGAGTGMAPFSDFATLTLLRKPKFTPEHDFIDHVGYRLEMNGKTQVMNVHLSKCVLPFCEPKSPNAEALGFAFPGTVVMSFKDKTKVSTMESLAKKITNAFPKATTTLLEFIGILQVDAHPLEMPAIAALLKSEATFSGMDINFEIYASPFEFTPATPLAARSGVMDMDSLRLVTKFYKDAGIPFVSETTIPKALQP